MRGNEQFRTVAFQTSIQNIQLLHKRYNATIHYLPYLEVHMKKKPVLFAHHSWNMQNNITKYHSLCIRECYVTCLKNCIYTFF